MSECIGVTFIWRSEKNKILNSNIEVSAVVKMNSCLIIDVNNLWFVLRIPIYTSHVVSSERIR